MVGHALLFQRTMNDRADVADLRKADCRSVETPYLRMWLTEPDDIERLSFPSRRPREPFKAALPRLVEFCEELGAHVARDVAEPGQIGAKIGKLPVLVKQRRVALVSAGQPHKALLVREIPQEPQGRLPREEPRPLGWRRVNAISEALVNKHDDAYNRDVTRRK